MTRHVLKLIWNRKRANGLILVELVACFVVLCAVTTMGLDALNRWRQPLGFAMERRWEVEIDGIPFLDVSDEEEARLGEMIRDMRRAVADRPEVEQAALVFNSPLAGSRSITATTIAGRTINMDQVVVDPVAGEVLQLELVAGRWLEEGDELRDFTPVVITRDLARTLFGDDGPMGQLMPFTERDGTLREVDGPEDIRRIVGLVSAYRRDGRLGDPTSHAAFSVNRSGRDYTTWSNIVFTVAPGTPRAFEETLLAVLRGIEPDWNYTVESYADRQDERRLETLMPLLLASIVAGFLIVMVGLGLVGVLWQAVIRRTREMGLRRALGATNEGVRGQIIAELLGLTAVAVALGALLFFQAPLLGMTGSIGYPVLVLAAVASAALLSVFVIVCGLYPSWLATRIEPARALQCE
jgi:putative ABC transport system permease protein